MALFSFLKGRGDARSTAVNLPGAQATSVGTLEMVRTRARRRLIGAAVLVLAAVVGLPMIFESKPRPVAADTPIEVSRGDGLPTVTVPVAKSSTVTLPAVPVPPVVEAVPPPPRDDVVPRKSARTETAKPREPITTESAADAGREIPPSAVTTLPPVDDERPLAKPKAPLATEGRAVSRSKDAATESTSERKHVAKPEHAPADKVVEKPPTHKMDESAKDVPKEPAKQVSKDVAAKDSAKKSDHAREAARARALLEGRDDVQDKPVKKAAAKPTAGGGEKFMVQVGAFGQPSSADAAKSKVENLGFKAHAQTIETAGGTRTRVRVGPFASREEADRAAERLRASGQGAAVIPQ